MPTQHLITITVDTTTGKFTYTENGTNVSRLNVRPGDTLEWAAGDPWTIDFGVRTPCNRKKSKHSDNPSKLKISLKSQPDFYKYYVAVAVKGDVFLDDPEIVIDPDDD